MKEIVMKTKITMTKLMMINKVIRVRKKNPLRLYKKTKTEVLIQGRQKILMFLLNFLIHHKVLIFQSTKMS
jgi:hypothetical protein